MNSFFSVSVGPRIFGSISQKISGVPFRGLSGMSCLHWTHGPEGTGVIFELDHPCNRTHVA